MSVLLDSDIAISTRVRLARNYTDLPFPAKMTRAQFKKLNERIVARLGRREFSRLDMSSLSPVERQVLVERHLASKELIDRQDGMLLLSKSETISIMAGEEDHLRIQCVLPGLRLEEADNLSRSVDAMLSADGYAFDPELGYLTACPTNVGTGMRASVMLHLPAMAMTGSIQSLIETVGKFGYTLRGYYGEGTKADGDMVQISNQVTLGLSEEEIIGNLSEVVRSIIKKERSAREALLKGDNGQLTDRLHRSLGILKYARRLSTEEMMQRLSDVKLALSLGLFEGVTAADLEKLTTLCQPASVAATLSGASTPEQRDEARARMVRVALKDCNVF